ncbi:hypothetical protein Tco_0018002 [Tanacetum coccineum]
MLPTPVCRVMLPATILTGRLRIPLGFLGWAVFLLSDMGLSVPVEMGLLDFIKTADPFKVKTDERTLAENEVPLLTETEDRVIAPSSQPMSLVDHTIQDELNVNSGKRKKRLAGKSPSALQRLSRRNEQASTGSGFAAPVTQDVISSSATPTLDFAHEDASHDNVRTRPAPDRFVVISSESTDADISASPQVVPPVTLDSAGATVPMAAPTGGDHPVSGFGPEAGTLSQTMSHKLLIPLLLRIFMFLTGMLSIMIGWLVLLLHVCMVSELRVRYEHEIMIREKFEKKFTESADVVQQRDAEIVDLNARLEKSEAETVEVAELCRPDLEVTIAMKVGELANLRTENVSLSERVSALELERDGLKDQVVGEGKMREEFLSQQDAVEQHFKERATKLDAQITDVRRDMDNDIYPHMLTTIAGQRWVVRHGFRLAVHKGANSVECQYTLGKVISMAINKGMLQGLEAGVVHGQADELEGLKDAPLASIMSALTLKDSEGDKDISSKLSRFQPSLDQVTVPIYSESGSIYREMPLSDAIPSIRRSAERRGLCPPSGIAPGEASGSAPSHDTSLAIADYQVSTLVLSGDGASVDQPPVVEPHDDLFDASVLAEPSGV